MLSNRRAVSDTGPMISAFQSDQVSLLEFLYQGGICIPRSTLPEYLGDSQSLIQGLINDNFVEICDLTQSQRDDAEEIAREIASNSPNNNWPDHYPEAEAIVLMKVKRQDEPQGWDLLLEERAAVTVARENCGLEGFVRGFAGLFVHTFEIRQIGADIPGEFQYTPEQVREILHTCQRCGTHYSTNFIEGLYRELRRRY